MYTDLLNTNNPKQDNSNVAKAHKFAQYQQSQTRHFKRWTVKLSQPKELHKEEKGNVIPVAVHKGRHHRIGIVGTKANETIIVQLSPISSFWEIIYSTKPCASSSNKDSRITQQNKQIESFCHILNHTNSD
jgi:hypothetical protein